MKTECYVCGKPAPFNELGFKLATHPRCRPGTKRWCEWFAALPESKKTETGKLIFNHYSKKGANHGASSDNTSDDK